MVHKHQKNNHNESLITPRCRIPSITQPINLEYKLIKHPNEPEYKPIILHTSVWHQTT
jgi:hypothetical protein